MRYKTNSLAGAYPIIQMWNYDLNSWEDYPSMAESLTFATITQPVFDWSDHISGGVAQMRIYKASNGNTNNHYYVDWLSVAKGYGTPSGEEIDPYSFHKGKNLDIRSFNITNVSYIKIPVSAQNEHLVIGGTREGNYAIYGNSTLGGVMGEGSIGVHGLGLGTGSYGISGEATGTDSKGVYGIGDTYGVRGYSETGSAGYFNSNNGFSLITRSGNVSLNNTFFINNKRVGIGTTSPTHELNVVGAVNVTGNLFVGGSITNSGASRMRVTKNDAQTFTNIIYTPIEYDDVTFDNLNELNASSEFVAKEAGYYEVKASIIFENTAWTAGELGILRLYKNNVRVSTLQRHSQQASLTYYLQLSGSDLIYLDVGDFIHISAYQGTGGSVNSLADNYYNYFSVHRLS